MNAVPPPPSLGGGSMLGIGRMLHHHHVHGQGVPTMPVHNSSSGNSQKDRSVRSIFVGNIPYEATESQLVEIFREVGPVVSFRLVYDKETSRPKGYGFCEYQDSETAASAVRNLASRELHGRTLRVDSSANAKLQQRQEEGPAAVAALAELPPITRVGPVDPEEAPKVIAEAVDKLPARHVYDILKHLKDIGRNYPEEAHQLLASHPHVAYATLLAQVTMGLVDPDIAEGLLHPPRPSPCVLRPQPARSSATPSIPSHNLPTSQLPPSSYPHSIPSHPPPSAGAPVHRYDRERESRGAAVFNSQQSQRSTQPSSGHRGDAPARAARGDGFETSGFGPRGPRAPPTAAGSSSRQQQLAGLRLPIPGGAMVGSDEEKAQLIMQVLNLNEEDLKLLTPEQRESVRVLKQQVSSAIK